VIAACGYLIRACQKNIDHLYDLPIEDATVVRELVQELVDRDHDRFAATELDNMSCTKESSPRAKYVGADGLSLMKDKRITRSASIFHMRANYLHYLYAVF